MYMHTVTIIKCYYKRNNIIEIGASVCDIS